MEHAPIQCEQLSMQSLQKLATQEGVARQPTKGDDLIHTLREHNAVLEATKCIGNGMTVCTLLHKL